MTLTEVKAATASLVFAQELADLDSVVEAGFFSALARAIWVTDALRPTRRILTLTHTPPFDDACEVGAADVLYDLRRLDASVAALLEPPAHMTEDGALPLTSNFVLSGGTRLYLNRALTGTYRLVVRLAPATPDDATDPELPLSLDEDLCQLLPLLTAHYLLLDDDPDKAEHYLSLYREQYNLLIGAGSLTPAVTWRSVNNW